MLVSREKEWWWVGKRSEVVKLGNEVVVFGIVQGQPCNKRTMQNELYKDNHLWKIMQNFPYMVWQVVWTANGWLQWQNIPNHGTMLMSELLHSVDNVFPAMEQCSCLSFSIVLTKYSQSWNNAHVRASPFCWQSIPSHGTMLISELLHCVDKVFPIMEQCSCPSFSIVLTKYSQSWNNAHVQASPLSWQSIPSHGTMLMSELLHCLDKVFPLMEQCSCPSFSILCCSGCGPIFDSAYIPNVHKNNLSQNGSLLSQKWSFWHWKKQRIHPRNLLFQHEAQSLPSTKGKKLKETKTL
jgi:hypothetical protein